MPKELHPYGVLLRPIITEKTTVLTGLDQYVFEVDLRANKNQIKEAVQLAFNVHVKDVNTMKMKGKAKRFGRKVTNRPDWKKAIVTLIPGEKIDLFEGI
jgi:large subunit ribosomal protein L23